MARAGEGTHQTGRAFGRPRRPQPLRHDDARRSRRAGRDGRPPAPRRPCPALCLCGHANPLCQTRGREPPQSKFRRRAGREPRGDFIWHTTAPSAPRWKTTAARFHLAGRLDINFRGRRTVQLRLEDAAQTENFSEETSFFRLQPPAVLLKRPLTDRAAHTKRCTGLTSGPFVYRLGRQVFSLERGSIPLRAATFLLQNT